MMTDLAKTALHDWHVANNGRMVDFAGWSMPVLYESIVAEHDATRNNIGLFDISHMGRLRFDGEEAVGFLDRILTRAVRPIPLGGIRYGLVTNEDGGILDDILVYRLADDDGEFYWLVVNASNRPKILAWIDSHRTSSDSFAMRDLTQDTAMFAVQGPHAVALGDAIFADPVSELGYYRGACTTVELDGQSTPAVVSRTGYTGEDGFEVTIGNDSAPALWRRILDEGSDAGIRPVGLGARDTLRLEAAMPLYGHELSEQISPVEAGLGFAVQLKERTFIGSDAIAQQKSAGVARVRIGLTLEGRRAPREGYPVLDGNGRQVGEITSGTFSPTLQKPIAMAYVETAAASQPLSIDIRGKVHAATTVDLPFYKRS